MAYKSGNPALNDKAFRNLDKDNTSATMTLQGVSLKSFVMLFLAFASGVYGWQLAENSAENIGIWIIIASLAGFGVALLTIFKRHLSPITAPLYALIQGLFLGAISQYYEESFDGIVLQAILITSGIFVSMLLLYLTHIIKVTENLKLGIFAATGGIALFYIASFVLSLFGVDVPLIHSNSGWGLAFSVAVVIVAALNLVVDFDFIEKGVEAKAPKYMEWYASFGLFVTIVWLYLEMLRLLAKARSR